MRRVGTAVQTSMIYYQIILIILTATKLVVSGRFGSGIYPADGGQTACDVFAVHLARSPGQQPLPPRGHIQLAQALLSGIHCFSEVSDSSLRGKMRRDTCVALTNQVAPRGPERAPSHHRIESRCV